MSIHIYFPFFLLLLLDFFTSHNPMPSIPNIKTIEAIIVPAEFISPRKVASKSAVSIYLATSINHFPNSSPIRYTFISAKIQLFMIQCKKKGRFFLKTYDMGTSMLHFVIWWKIKLKKFGANRENLYLCNQLFMVSEYKLITILLNREY